MEHEIKKYEELLNFIRKEIEDGNLLPGQKLASENELAEQFGISRQTVRRAIGVLEDQGVVRRVRGSGTYLNDPRGKVIENRNRIAVVTTYVDSYIFPKTIQGIERQLFERGYSVQLSFTNNTLERERSVLTHIINRGDVAGVIVEGTKQERIAKPQHSSVQTADQEEDPDPFYQYILSRSGCAACIAGRCAGSAEGSGVSDRKRSSRYRRDPEAG